MDDSKKNLHKQHRQRLLNRFREEDLDHFSPHNALETLLFFAIPRKDTNPIAHRLIEYFGSISGVLDASLEDLMEIEGMGEHSATLLKLVASFTRIYMMDRTKDVCLNSSEKAGRYLSARFIGLREETVFMLSLDAKYRVLATTILDRGSIEASEINIRKVVSTALRYNAVSVIIAHNHPSGVALPSPNDLTATEKIHAGLSTVGVKLVDHIIVADNDFVSLADSGIIR